MNKDKAMQMLKAKLYIFKTAGAVGKGERYPRRIQRDWLGSQIRSYVLQPYTMVKDHRTGAEIGNVQDVLDGNLDPFINAYLAWITK